MPQWHTEVLEAPRYPRRPGAVAEPAQHLPPHTRNEVAEKLTASQRGIPSIDRGDQRYRSGLRQILR
jgi:hypothetical protein